MLLVYAAGALPLTNLLEGMPPVTLGDAISGRQALPYPAMSIESLLQAIEWMDAIAGLACAALLFLVLSSTRTSNQRSPASLRQLLLGLTLLVLPNLLLALTAKYQHWAATARPYLTSSYALFGWALVLTCSIRIVGSRLAVALIGALFCVIFLYSAAYNHITAKRMRASFSRWDAASALVACREQLRKYDSFVMPAMFEGVLEKASNWSVYWRDWTRTSFGVPLRVVPDLESAREEPAAFVHLDRGHRGGLKSLAGRSESHGFVVYRYETPNYLSIRAIGREPGGKQLFTVRDLQQSRCARGYRVATFDAASPILDVEVGWELPDAEAFSFRRSNPFEVGDSDIPRALQALYLGFLKRPAEPHGLSFWTDRVRRAGGSLRDVAEGISGAFEPGQEQLPEDFAARLAESYQRLVGRPPGTDEVKRLSTDENRTELMPFLPWLVASDLIRSDDAVFENRLRLARYYSESVFPVVGWRAPLWERSIRVITASPESVQHAIDLLSQR